MELTSFCFCKGIEEGVDREPTVFKMVDHIIASELPFRPELTIFLRYCLDKKDTEINKFEIELFRDGEAEAWKSTGDVRPWPEEHRERDVYSISHAVPFCVDIQEPGIYSLKLSEKCGRSYETKLWIKRFEESDADKDLQYIDGCMVIHYPFFM